VILKKYGKKGFTLVECLVSLAFFSLLGIFVYININSTYKNKVCSKNKINALRHCESLIEDLTALYNSDDLSKDLDYYNLDMIELLNTVKNLQKGGESSVYKLVSDNGDYDIVFEKTDEEDCYLALRVKCQDGTAEAKCQIDFTLYDYK
jgi:prepilin-type N-terminal cleavage/methylation domain-containing protein